jgi:DNA polymerase-3 subunit delta'
MPHRIAASVRKQPRYCATALRRSAPSPILPRVPTRHLLPLHGHSALRARLVGAVARGDLPSSLLIEGPRGVGKQQLALWLGRLLLCEDPENDLLVEESDSPKGASRPSDRTRCRACKLTESIQHPDLQWVFPRPRLKGSSDPDLADIREDMAEGIAERLANGGLYEPPGGDEGIFIATIRSIVQTAVLKPAMARRKVFIIGDAERMVSQEGSDQAANAFLKLLEEPPADTTVILTSSEPGALLPTVRSRVIAVRALPLTDAEMKAFVEDKRIAPLLDLPTNSAELVKSASGAPGRLAERDAWTAAIDQATRFLDAASAPDRGRRARVAMSQGVSGARGKFSDTLDALTSLLHDRAQAAAERGEDKRASGAARAIAVVERTKELATGNVNPQLLTAALIRDLAPLVR